MAQDSATQGGSKPNEINLDEIEVSVLILGKNLSMLSQAAGFLTRRGWPATVLSNVSEAIEYVAKNKPDIVLISVNHPNPAVQKLPDLITQTFNLTCVGFAEQTDSMSQARINKLKMRYKITSGPSGPNLQRAIRKILAEKFNIQMDEPQTKGDEKSEKTKMSLSELAGLGAAKDGDGIQMSASDDSEVAGNDSGVAYNGLGKGNSGGEGDGVDIIGLQANVSGRQRAPGDASENLDTETSSLAHVPKPGEKRKRLRDLTQVGRGTEPSTGSSSFAQGALVGGTEEGSGVDLIGQLKKSLFGGGGEETSFPDPESASIHPVGIIQNGETTAVEASLDSGSQAGLEIPPLTAEDLAKLPPRSLLERAVKAALQKVCSLTPVERPLPVISKVAVFPCASALLPGYLVIAVDESPRAIEHFFLANCERAVRKEFLALSVPAELESGFWVHLPEVTFANWAAAKAQFHVLIPNDGSQVGVAFFLTQKQLPKAVEMEGQNMFSVSVDEISTEHPVNFKAYLHLKENQKYFLYLRNGRQLQPEQKERLKENNIQNIFMRPEDVENLRMFLAASYLRGSLKEAA